MEPHIEDWDIPNRFIVMTGVPPHRVCINMNIFNFLKFLRNLSENCCVVIDDLYLKLCQSEEFAQFFIVSRHHEVSFILITQNLFTNGRWGKTLRY